MSLNSDLCSSACPINEDIKTLAIGHEKVIEVISETFEFARGDNGELYVLIPNFGYPYYSRLGTSEVNNMIFMFAQMFIPGYSGGDIHYLNEEIFYSVSGSDRQIGQISKFFYIKENEQTSEFF